MALTQTDQTAILTTPLGENVLVLSHFSGSEALSEPNAFSVEAVSEEQNIDFDSALGLNCGITINCVDGLKRYFNGVLVEAEWVGVRYELYVYKLVLRPWLWLLGHTSDCRIFSNKSVPEIMKEVFQDRGFPNYRDALTRSYPVLEYCVQYRESDLNFVCRLMEEYGIYYFFEHSEDKHTLVLADAKSSHKPPPGLAKIPYLPPQVGDRSDEQRLSSWSTARSFESGRYTLNDYDYNKPRLKLLAEAYDAGDYANGSMEFYDYRGRYYQQSIGETLARIRVDAEQARDQRRSAVGAAPSLYPGCLITLEQHPVDSENAEYLVLRCSHSCSSQNYRSGGGANNAYSGAYEFVKSERQFRAPLFAQRPIIPGPQSALVVGKEGEEIDVDELGRVCVQFYWDRKKTASRRVRVAQVWAGGYRGALFLPRIGDEVMILHEDGDPDRPLVVGSVYNGVNTVPTDLPRKKTRSGILTKSSKDSSGYNMLLFDDTAGDEHIKLRAQKDLMFKALNNEQRDILASQTENVGKDVTQKVGGNESITVGGPSSGGDYTLTAQQKIVLKVGGSTLTIDGSGISLSAPTITIKADAQTSVRAPIVSLTGDATVTISGSATEIGETVTITGALLTS